MEQFPILNPEMKTAFDAFPMDIRNRLLQLRSWILSIGNHIQSIGRVEETLKWGEPSYVTITGSPIRLSWKKSKPNQFAVCFHCQTKLVSVFRQLYPDKFSFDGNRAIVFQKNDRIPEPELKHCIEMAHGYHVWKDKALTDFGLNRVARN